MKLNTLNAISPIDGRYHSKTLSYSNFFSEYALIKYRVLVEVNTLCLNRNQFQILTIFLKNNPKIKKIYSEFNENDALEIKKIEKETNHDVKAVEYFIKNEFKKLKLDNYLEFIHLD